MAFADRAIDHLFVVAAHSSSMTKVISRSTL